MKQVWEVFEDDVEMLLQQMGYQTEKHVMVRGDTSLHEVDVLGKRRGRMKLRDPLGFMKTERLYVECKYRGNPKTTLEKRDIGNFLLALDDTNHENGAMVTNVDVSGSIKGLGKKYRIDVVDGDQLDELFISYNMVPRYINYRKTPENPLNYTVKKGFDFLEDMGVFRGLEGD